MGTGKGSNSDNIKNEELSSDSGSNKTIGSTSLGSYSTHYPCHHYLQASHQHILYQLPSNLMYTEK